MPRQTKFMHRKIIRRQHTKTLNKNPDAIQPAPATVTTVTEEVKAIPKPKFIYKGTFQYQFASLEEVRPEDIQNVIANCYETDNGLIYIFSNSDSAYYFLNWIIDKKEFPNFDTTKTELNSKYVATEEPPHSSYFKYFGYYRPPAKGSEVYCVNLTEEQHLFLVEKHANRQKEFKFLKKPDDKKVTIDPPVNHLILNATPEETARFAIDKPSCVCPEKSFVFKLCNYYGAGKDLTGIGYETKDRVLYALHTYTDACYFYNWTTNEGIFPVFINKPSPRFSSTYFCITMTREKHELLVQKGAAQKNDNNIKLVVSKPEPASIATNSLFAKKPSALSEEIESDYYSRNLCMVRERDRRFDAW